MKLLDIFCGAGGCSVGYSRAGFTVTGVDLNSQPNYPFQFHQANALTFPLKGFDAVHASPPCQRFSRMSNCRPGLSQEYPDLIAAVRKRLTKYGIPFVIENVPGAPLIDPVTLCGTMFGLELYRHRLFECSFKLIPPVHPAHTVPASKAGHWKPGTIISVAGHFAPMQVAQAAMGIDWMRGSEMAESVPPAYTEFIGKQLRKSIQQE